jgi:hypothetical protein
LLGKIAPVAGVRGSICFEIYSILSLVAKFPTILFPIQNPESRQYIFSDNISTNSIRQVQQQIQAFTLPIYSIGSKIIY